MKTALIIPTYNEKDNIEKLINEIIKVNSELQIVVVDDNSPDGTSNIVLDISAKNKNIHLIKREKKLGLGTAHIAGFLYAEKDLKTDYVITMDSDFSHNPSIIPEIIRTLKENDVVVGSRYTEGGEVIDSPFVRRLISKTANFLTTYLLGLKVKDATSGFRGYKIEALKKIDYNNIFSDGYSFLVELVYRLSILNDVKIKEIPIRFVDRKAGKSKISKKEIFKAIKTIFTLFFIKIFSKDNAIELLDKKFTNLSIINYIRLRFHISRYKKVASMLKKGNILDLGCGRPAEFMKDQSFLIFLKNENAVGLDLKNIEKPKYNFIQTEIPPIPFENEKFDNIVMMELIEHIEDINSTLLEAKRIIKEDGVLIIATPDNNYIWDFIWDKWSRTFGKIWKHQHISNFNKSEWEKIILKHFRINKIQRNWFFDLIFQCSKK
ncbi:MAG: glycosyltransferase [Elusimicrobiota bacterium]